MTLQPPSRVQYRTGLPLLYAPNLVRFDGEADELEKSSGISCPVFESFTFACEITPRSADHTNGRILAFTELNNVVHGAYVQLPRFNLNHTTRICQVDMYDESIDEYQMILSGHDTPLSASARTHVFFRWNKDDGGQWFLDGVADSTPVADIGYDIDATGVDWISVGGGQADLGYPNLLSADIGNLWFAYNQYLAPSAFVGKNLPSNGDAGDGQPLIWMAGNAAAWNAGTNGGTLTGLTLIPALASPTTRGVTDV